MPSGGSSQAAHEVEVERGRSAALLSELSTAKAAAAAARAAADAAAEELRTVRAAADTASRFDSGSVYAELSQARSELSAFRERVAQLESGQPGSATFAGKCLWETALVQLW